MTSYKLILRNLERIIKHRGFDLTLEDLAIDTRNRSELEGFGWQTLIEYKIAGANGEVHIYQTVSFQHPSPSEIEKQIQNFNGIYPIEDLLTGYTPVTKLAVTYFDQEGYEIEMEIKPNGRIESSYPEFYVQGEYEEAFAKLLDILENKIS